MMRLGKSRTTEPIKIISLLLISAFLLIPIQSSIAANPKFGDSCPELNIEKKFQEITYVCLNVKGKLVWTGKQYGFSNKNVVTGKNAPRDFVNIKGSITYGISKSLLTRKSDKGVYFKSDSRQMNSFNKFRINAYKALNPNSKNRAHSNIEFAYTVTTNFPKYLVSFYKRDLDEAASFWNESFESKTLVKVYLITESDKKLIDENSWINRNLGDTYDRIQSRGEKPFVAGSADYWDHNGVKYGELYLFTSSDLQLTYVRDGWSQVAKHEFAHIVQGYYLNKSSNLEFENSYVKRSPVNFTEGSANTIGFLTGFRNIGWSSDALDSKLWDDLRSKSDWRTVKTVEEVKELIYLTELNEPRQAFDLAYSIGALIYEYYVGEYGLEAFKKLLTQTSLNESFDDSFRNSIGISKDQFYTEAANYIFGEIKRLKPYG